MNKMIKKYIAESSDETRILEFDTNGNLIKRTYKWDNIGQEPMETYEYENGKMVKSIIESHDGRL